MRVDHILARFSSSRTLCERSGDRHMSSSMPLLIVASELSENIVIVIIATLKISVNWFEKFLLDFYPNDSS